MHTFLFVFISTRFVCRTTLAFTILDFVVAVMMNCTFDPDPMYHIDMDNYDNSNCTGTPSGSTCALLCQPGYTPSSAAITCSNAAWIVDETTCTGKNN